MPLPSGLQSFCYQLADSIMVIPLYMILFFLVAFRILFNFCHFNYDIFWCRSFCFHFILDLLCFLYLDNNFLQVWEVFIHKSIKFIFDLCFFLINYTPL